MEHININKLFICQAGFVSSCNAVMIIRISTIEPPKKIISRPIPLLKRIKKKLQMYNTLMSVY